MLAVHVPIQVAAMTGGVVAQTALVRLLARVRAMVRLEVAARAERVRAQGAHERPLGRGAAQRHGVYDVC